MRFFLALACFSLAAFGQSNQFRYAARASTSTATQELASGGTIQFPATRIGGTSVVTLSMTNTSADTWTLAEVSTVGVGFTTSFTVTSIRPNATGTAQIQLSPRTEDAPWSSGSPRPTASLPPLTSS
jgi:hypothetical protein